MQIQCALATYTDITGAVDVDTAVNTQFHPAVAITADHVDETVSVVYQYLCALLSTQPYVL
jgi:hypothetical protein